MDASDTEDLWYGQCDCGAEFSLGDARLRETYPQYADEFANGGFSAPCPACRRSIEFHCQRVKAMPFSSWQVLPPVAGCPECGTAHPPEMPHNLQSLVYQYQFRSREAKAGREERWPTWHDAMAHCSPIVKDAWTKSLADHGIII